MENDNLKKILVTSLGILILYFGLKTHEPLLGLFGFLLTIAGLNLKMYIRPYVMAYIIKDGRAMSDIYNLSLVKDTILITKGLVHKKVILNKKLKDILFEYKRQYTPAEYETIEKDKSVIGRAIVGGLLLGPVGAIVGGMSGIGTQKETQITQKEQDNMYFYIKDDTNEFLFNIHPSHKHNGLKFYNKIQQLSKS